MKFILEVPDDIGVTLCGECPWINNEDVCQYCDDNNLCGRYNFSKVHIKKYNENQ